MGVLRTGTSSFSEKTWVGPFYPEGTAPADFLRYYATQFDTVEADVTYYRVPSPDLVRGWDAKTPPGFRLCAKFPKTVVHGGTAAQPDPEAILDSDRARADTDEFLSAMALLGDKCGPLVLQFPYFNKRAFASPGPFLERLDRYLASLPDSFRYAVEIRNEWWVRPPLLDVLRERRAAFVFVELGYGPHPAEAARRQDLVTADFAYARLIGDRKAVEDRTKTFDRIVVHKPRALDRWAELLGKVMERVPLVYAFANNHYQGHGPATIRDLRARISG